MCIVLTTRRGQVETVLYGAPSHPHSFIRLSLLTTSPHGTGAYTVLYLICMYILSSRYRAVKSKAKASLVMMSVASALYALSSAHVIINLVRAIGAFIDDAKDAEVVLERISSPLSVGKQVVYVLSS